MSSKFTIVWNNSVVNASTNALTQTIGYRRKSIGGAFITVGFIPSNNLAKSVGSALSPILLSNVIYEFRVQTNCTENGPTYNDNGIKEMIGFDCIEPIIETTDVTSTISVEVSDTDITKARFTVRRASNDSIVGLRITALNVANTITGTKTGLLPNTSYYWQVEFYSTINGLEVIGTVCSGYDFITES